MVLNLILVATDFASNKTQRHLEKEMSSQSEQKSIRSTTTTLDLNDDVLRETFRHLNASDLCAVADVCSAFKRNAQAEFSLRFTGLHFNAQVLIKDYDTDGDYKFNTATLQIRQLAPMLRNFGSSLNAIHICSPHVRWSHQITKLVAKYSGESLNCLYFNRIHFTRDAINELRPVLSRLERLKLDFCSWNSRFVASEMFSFCSELHTLSLAGAVSLDTPVALPELKSLVFDYYRHDSDEDLIRFLSVNPQLKAISIECHVIYGEILPIIAKCTPQVEKLKFTPVSGFMRDFVGNAEHLKRLTALKSLEIKCSSFSLGLVLGESLESLDLERFRADREFVTELSKWKQLTRLGQVYCSYQDMKLSDILMIVRNLSELTELKLIYVRDSIADLVEIVRWAPKLQKLTYGSLTGSSIDLDLFMKVRSVVANREQSCPRSLVWHLYNVKLDVPEESLNANKDILILSKVNKYELH